MPAFPAAVFGGESEDIAQIDQLGFAAVVVDTVVVIDDVDVAVGGHRQAMSAVRGVAASTGCGIRKKGIASLIDTPL